MEKVLVCLLASTRAHELTFPNFKRQVLDELDGDLALALAIGDRYDCSNAFWQHSKYRWTAPQFKDWGEAFDLAQRWLCKMHGVPAPDWRSMLRIKGIWQGGIASPDGQPSVSSILPFCRWLLLNGLQTDDVLNRYDRFVITRSDFIWLCPHPPLSVLGRNAIWVPDGEYWGGLPDRHLVASRDDVVNCLNIIEDILLHPDQLYEEMKHWQKWNNEQFLAHHLQRKGLYQKVKVFPYVMYTARSLLDDSPAWVRGRYEPAVGHVIKYDSEFRNASAYAPIIRSRADWENRAWAQFDPTSVTSEPLSLPRRLLYTCDYSYNMVMSGLVRPGRLARLMRFLRRILRRSAVSKLPENERPLRRNDRNVFLNDRVAH